MMEMETVKNTAGITSGNVNPLSYCSYRIVKQTPQTLVPTFAVPLGPDFGAWREPQSCHVYPHKFATIPLLVLFKRTSAKRELENKQGMRQKSECTDTCNLD